MKETEFFKRGNWRERIHLISKDCLKSDFSKSTRKQLNVISILKLLWNETYTHLSSTHWLYNQNHPRYNGEDSIPWEGYYFSSQDSYENHGFNLLRDSTCNGQSQRNLGGIAPFGVLHCDPPLLGPFPLTSFSEIRAQESQKCIKYKNPSCLREMSSDFFHPNIMEIGWKGRRWKSLPVYGKQCFLVLKMLPFLRAIHPQSWTVRQMSCCFLWGCYILMSSLAEGEMQKYILGSLHLSLEETSVVIELR